MQNFDPTIHHRRSIRLKGYDYSQEGLYFVTICVQNRDCIFGNVVDGKMMLNNAGQIAHNEWLKTAELRKNVQLHNFVVMPNHFHTIFEITVGAYCIRPDIESDKTVGAYCIRLDIESDVHDGLHKGVCNTPLPNAQPGVYEGVCNTPLRSPTQTVGAIIRGYKSAVTRQMDALKISFNWQRNMYEHIIRDYNDYARIDEYIFNNPEKWESDKLYKKL